MTEKKSGMTEDGMDSCFRRNDIRECAGVIDDGGRRWIFGKIKELLLPGELDF
ncbi:hypothetical protein ES705_06992 [subsurface metagenome]